MCAHRPLSTVEVRKENRNRVYRRLTASWDPVTKQELAFLLSMSLPTLSQNLNELAEMGLIDRSSTTDSTGGRRPKLITPLPNARFALGAELTGGDLRLVAVNLRQEPLAYQKIYLPFANTPEYGAHLAELIESFLDKNRLDRGKLLGVSLALPGIIGPGQDTIEYAPTIGIHAPTPCRFTQAIPYPILLDNDANCGGFGEWWNHTEEPQNMAYLSLSQGVGGAILVGGKLYDGVSHRAAEFGHLCLYPAGRRCQCGRRGCLEAYCSAARLSTDLNISLETFFHRLSQGDPACQNVWQAYLDDLALAVTTIHTILDCPVLIGGSVSQYLPPFRVQLAQRIRDLDPLSPRADFFSVCPNSSHSVCIGAATRLLDRFIREI